MAKGKTVPDEERTCAYPNCYEYIDTTGKYSCSDYGARFCEEHLEARSVSIGGLCTLCAAYQGRTMKMRQYASKQLAWTTGNELIKILNKLGVSGWRLAHVDKKEEYDSGNLWKCIFFREIV